MKDQERRLRPVLEAVEGLLDDVRTGRTTRDADEIAQLEALRERMAQEVREACRLSLAGS